MFSIQFEATVKNGMIQIPQEYLIKLQPPLKVIILQDKSRVESASKKKEQFLSSVAKHRFDLPQNYNFNREELYDRG